VTQNTQDQRLATADETTPQTASRVRCIRWLCKTTCDGASKDMGMTVAEWILVLAVAMSLFTARLMWERL
jgi:hypothetical protein